MIIFNNEEEISAFLQSKQQPIGFVPTMGALHEGHLSLIKKASFENKTVVVSIFVNPIQFDNQEDLEKYPQTLENDIQKIKTINPDVIVFAPDRDSVFKNKDISYAFEFNGLDKTMEGAFRKNHFNGVATIVKILFDIIQPTKAYFGEKDFQQLQIIKKLTHQLQLPITIIGCPIVRENNGLAMSSRNERLSQNTRLKAKIIYESLQNTQNLFPQMELNQLTKLVFETFKQSTDFELEYFEIVDADTLQPQKNKQSKTSYRAFIAVKTENIRLIDNISLN